MYSVLKGGSQVNSKSTTLTFHKAAEDGVATIITVPTETSEALEAVFEVQGVLLAFDLPPITSKSQILPKPAWAKQSVKVVGLGAPEFDQAIAGIGAVHRRLSGLYKVDALQAWAAGRQAQFPELDFSNRYVTPHSLVRGQLASPFGAYIDPHDILATATKAIGLHVDDNIVLYYDKPSDYLPVASEVIFREIDPAVIRAGQIVQLQVSFSTVPMWGRKGMYRMVSKLRSVTILDRELHEVRQHQGFLR
ncbi:hypothetical protein BV25DRAFT_1807174 [Artomyces pyxidatus]|uniref:Uncharacterized protein n=1 Tax=Artomyces pyxidatus TaxID=48021 RepID=A0ACB8SXJ4_9AGAM|nr:hypothetical protein BV25DRAFT_1807174 [Artomyces pyxidatus]